MSRIFNDLNERKMINERTKEDIIEILDNIVYWDSCPIAYKEKIPRLINELKQVKNIAYEPVLSDSVCKHEWTRLDRDRISCTKCEMIQSRT